MLGIVIITTISLIFSIIIVFLEEKLDNEEATSKKFLELLPGYNCGACGYISCSGMADAMENDINNYKKCKPLKGDNLREMEMYVKKISERKPN